LGFGDSAFGFMLEFKVYGLWFMVYGLWFMVYGLWFAIQGSGFRVSGLRFCLGVEILRVVTWLPPGGGWRWSDPPRITCIIIIINILFIILTGKP